VSVTTRRDGDARPAAWTAAPSPAGDTGRPRVASLAWTFVRQVHGDRVAIVDAPAGPIELDADALVSAAAATPLAVLGADCALVGLASPQGPVGAAHAGWRGALAGVLERTVDAMRALGASEIVAVLGPCIHAECYEFGERELDLVAGRYGDAVRSTTADGRPALDLPMLVERSLERAGVAPPEQIAGCTACDDRWYSHRARGDLERHALAVWREERVGP